MKKTRNSFFGLDAKPSRPFKLFIAVLPLVVCLAAYFTASHIRHKENPQDKILPTLSQMHDAVVRMALTEDAQTGTYLMLNDIRASLKRLFIGIIIASLLGLLIGINMGLFAGIESLTSLFMTILSIIPPLAVLPILFIIIGVDELAKITLIFLGTFPFICRDIYIYTKTIPKEQITKSLTLGASEFQITYGIIMPQVIPRLIDTTRLSFGAAWLFLIASEAIAATEGLGYRIFLVRRYLAMDIIIPYVILITFLGFSTDWLLKKILAWKFSWYREQNQ